VIAWLLAPLSLGVMFILIGTGARLFEGSVYMGGFRFLLYLANRNNSKTIKLNLAPLKKNLKV